MLILFFDHFYITIKFKLLLHIQLALLHTYSMKRFSTILTTFWLHIKIIKIVRSVFKWSMIMYTLARTFAVSWKIANVFVESEKNITLQPYKFIKCMTCFTFLYNFYPSVLFMWLFEFLEPKAPGIGRCANCVVSASNGPHFNGPHFSRNRCL